MVRAALAIGAGLFLAAALLGRFAAPEMGAAGHGLFPWSYDAAKNALVAAQLGEARPEGQLEIARDQLAWAPASAEPLVYAALAAGSNDPEVDSLTLAQEARRRHPRLDLSHAWLMQHYLQAGELDLALASIGRLIRLRPQATDQINTLLTALVDDDQGWESIAAAAAGNPEWRASLVRVLLGRSDRRSEDVVEALLSPRELRDEGTDRLKAQYVNNLVSRAEYRRAYAAWRKFFAGRVDGANALVRNPELHTTDVPGAFGWGLYRGPAGTAEYMENGGVAVRYSGQKEIALLRQLLLLPPGRYRLDLTVKADGLSSGPRVEYRISCDRASEALLTGEVDRLGAAPVRLRPPFEVPGNGCPAQNLQIFGMPTAGTAPSNVQIVSVDVERIGR